MTYNRGNSSPTLNFIIHLVVELLLELCPIPVECPAESPIDNTSGNVLLLNERLITLIFYIY